MLKLYVDIGVVFTLKAFPANQPKDRMIHEFIFMTNYDPAFSVLQQKQHFCSLQSLSLANDTCVHISSYSCLAVERPSLIHCSMSLEFWCLSLK